MFDVERNQAMELCPKCGSGNRTITASIVDAMSFAEDVKTTVIKYPRALLSIAQTLIDQGFFTIAIVTSHMAAEIAADRAFDAAYQAKGLSQLGNAIDVLMNGSNLANEKYRDIYNALAGVTIQNEPFWNAFKVASRKRNGIIHASEQATKDEAEAALKASTDLATFLNEF